MHEAAPVRVVFGDWSLDRVPDEVAALGLRRVLVIAGGAAAAPGDRVAAGLGSRAAGRFDRVAPHVPEPLLTDAVQTARTAGADGLCSVGGGSATGLAKAVAVALAHAIAALASRAYQPVAALYAAEAVRLLVPALPAALADPGDRTARGELLWAGWLAGSALSAAGTGLHHRLCHVLGGRHRLVHADLHAVLLPYTLARDEALDRSALTGLLGPDPVAALRELAQAAGLPDRLAAIGTPADELAAAAAEAAERVDPHHPRHGDAAWFRALLADAHQPREGA